MSHLNGFEILILFYILHDCISEVQIKFRIFIESHGYSKLLMTSCPPSSVRDRILWQGVWFLVCTRKPVYLEKTYQSRYMYGLVNQIHITTVGIAALVKG